MHNFGKYFPVLSQYFSRFIIYFRDNVQVCWVRLTDAKVGEGDEEWEEDVLGLNERVEERRGAMVDPGKQQEGEKGQPHKEKTNLYLLFKVEKKV